MYIALFFSSLIAATLIPLSSEAGLIVALALDFDPVICILVASAGNCIGATINYVAGRNGVHWILTKLFKFDDKKLEKYNLRFERHSTLFLLASWLPIVGDPITVYLGVIHLPFQRFALYVYGTRSLRYVIITAIYLAGN